MSEAEFTATGVRIERWTRSLTRAGQVLIKDGRLALLTSSGREIDSAPLTTVSAAKPWFAKVGRMVATVNGTRYRLTMGQRNMPLDSSRSVSTFLDAVHRGSRR